MEENEPSKTARRVALRRAAHQVLDRPVVFEDPLALKIVGPQVESVLRADPERTEHSPLSTYLRAFMAARSRYAEDELRKLVDQGLTQFVILGAGLDTFAYRNPYPNLQVFEVDHPATQAWKRTVLTDAGISIPPTLTFAPLNFETQSLADALQTAGFNRNAPAFFSWLGVTQYLTLDPIQATLKFVASLPQGSGIVFDYGLVPGILTSRQRVAFDYMVDRVAKAGEPWQTFFEPQTLISDLRHYGYTHIEDLAGPEINRRYFSNRDDGLMVGSLAHLMCALV